MSISERSNAYQKKYKPLLLIVGFLFLSLVLCSLPCAQVVRAGVLDENKDTTLNGHSSEEHSAHDENNNDFVADKSSAARLSVAHENNQKAGHSPARKVIRFIQICLIRMGQAVQAVSERLSDALVCLRTSDEEVSDKGIVGIAYSGQVVVVIQGECPEELEPCPEACSEVCSDDCYLDILEACSSRCSDYGYLDITERLRSQN